MSEGQRIQHDVATGNVNRIAGGLLGLAAGVTLVMGVERALFWSSEAAGSQLGAGEAAGIFVGGTLMVIGLLVGLAARAVWRDERRGWIGAVAGGFAMLGAGLIALTTPGPPPVPIAVSAGAVAIGTSLVALSIGRWIREALR